MVEQPASANSKRSRFMRRDYSPQATRGRKTCRCAGSEGSSGKLVEQVMPDELFSILMRFHREVVLPDIERIVGGVVDSRVTALRDEMLSNFDAVYKRFDRLESEYHSLSAAVKRLEERLDRTALRSELLELKARVAALEEKIAQLESEI